eukprot:gene11324-12510_t
MYGYNVYNPPLSSYASNGNIATSPAHANYYNNNEIWSSASASSRSPPNYAVQAPYQYHEYERTPHGAAGVPPSVSSHHHHHHHGGSSSCNNNCCCPRVSQHQQTLRHDPQSWQVSRQDSYQNSLNETMTSMSSERNSVVSHEFYEGRLPNDPREWSAHDVFLWVNWAARNYRINNAFPERFQMNGKALCLMDASMFLYRVPQGGEMLYQDFQCRLQRAVNDERTYSR